MSRRTVAFVRLSGAFFVFASACGAAFVIAKLYTGRGAATPIRAAIYEQPLVALAGLAGVALAAWMAIQPREFIAARAWLNPRWAWRERRGEAILLTISLAFGMLLLEVGSRALYARDERLHFFYPPEFLVYPSLYHAMRDYDGGATNVLLLGGSVLEGAGRGHKIQTELGPPWRVYNLAQSAHSTLDSVTKYCWLLDHGYTFDYVIFYHGINEVRANNVPPESFRDDYSHYLFYRLVHTVFGEKHRIRRAALHSALYFRADRLVAQLRETRAFGRRFVNIEYPREDWLVYGSDIRSAAPFETNLLAIADLANRNGAKLIVAEFAYDPRLDDYVNGVPGAWTRERMDEYTMLWGLAANVRNGMVAHNAVVREHADRYTLVATDVLRRSGYFVDSCHFAPNGESAFISLLAQALTSEDESQ